MDCQARVARHEPAVQEKRSSRADASKGDGAAKRCAGNISRRGRRAWSKRSPRCRNITRRGSELAIMHCARGREARLLPAPTALVGGSSAAIRASKPALPRHRPRLRDYVPANLVRDAAAEVAALESEYPRTQGAASKPTLSSISLPRRWPD